MLKTVVLCNNFVETSKEQHLFEIEIFCNVIHDICTVNFDQFNANPKLFLALIRGFVAKTLYFVARKAIHFTQEIVEAIWRLITLN